MNCKYCNSTRYSEIYCENCIREFLRGEFSKWSSGDETVDKFIQHNQLQASVPPFILEWISPDQFENITYLNKGGFGKIHLAKWKRGPIMDWDEKKRQFVYEGTVDIVLKSLNEFSERFYDEVNNYFKIKSGNLVKCYGITKFPNSDNYVMVMNYYKEGTLYDYLKSHRSRINLKDKIYFIYRICFALYRIHSNNYIHRDLHSKNILLLTNRCLISDLGLCGPAENNLADACGVLPYMAPELLKKKPYSKASDIYSLGMLMWEIFAERPPFHDQHHDLDLYLGIIGGERPQMLSVIPDNFKQLIKKCWTEDAKERPEIEKIYGDVNKEFIKIYENEELMLKYENKRATEFLEIPKSPYPTHHTSSANG
ncbi:kinase-like protein, partial [Rhizophagus irregularis]